VHEGGLAGVVQALFVFFVVGWVGVVRWGAFLGRGERRVRGGGETTSEARNAIVPAYNDRRKQLTKNKIFAFLLYRPSWFNTL